jgi:FlaA1/EpsC-like NDP-sugar epimerase
MSALSRRLLRAQAFSLILLDAGSVVIAFWLALTFRFDGRIPAVDQRLMFVSLPAIVTLFVAINYLLGLYRYVWRYTSATEVRTIGAAAAASTLLLFVPSALWRVARPVPLSVVCLGGLFAAALFTIVRYRERLLTGSMGYLQRLVGSPDRQRVLIVGAGEAGHLLARQLQTADGRRRYEVVGFVDDDPKKQQKRTYDARVLGNRRAIPALVAQRDVTLVVIAIHKIGGADLREILSICLETPARVKILPDFLGAIEQPTGVLPLRDIDAEDLLGREQCQVDLQACREIVAGKVVLVTGAAGSIGSELCRQVLALGPRRLLMLDNNETGLHDLLISLHPPDRSQVLPLVADVTNQARVAAIFAQQHPQVIFHVAAYKHVPMMETHPDEAVRVNVLGTSVVADLAARHAAERFVLISTDKAVNPSSIMGATKRVGELLMTSRAAEAAECHGRTLFTAVRFGNVLGSRGSVAPTFVRQIEQGGPVTVTHPEMTRFFISIAEAVSLVIQAATMTSGGDIFMLDMGQPIRIEDLAYKMIRLRGLRPGADIAIDYTGVRPGEKLHEELYTEAETRSQTSHAKIFRISGTAALEAQQLAGRVAWMVELAHQQRVDDLVEQLWSLVQSDTSETASAGDDLLDLPAGQRARERDLVRELGGVTTR